MARVDQAPEDRDKERLTREQTLDCPQCGAMFDEIYEAPPGVYEVEDLDDEMPGKESTCPGCGYVWETEYEGWRAHHDAG